MDIYLYSVTFLKSPGEKGGGARSTDTTVKYLRKYGHNVTTFSSLKSLEQSIKKKKKKKPDLILHHNIFNLYRIYKLTKKKKIPLIVTLNDEITCINSTHIIFKNNFGTPCLKCTLLKALYCNLFNKQKYIKDRIKDVLTVPIRYIIRNYRLKALKNCDGIICIGETGRRLLNIAGIKRKIYVCPQSIDDSFLEKENIIKKRKKEKEEKREKIIFLPKTGYQDAPDSIIEAFLKAKIPNAKIICPDIIICHPKHKEIIKKFSKYDNVKFIKFIPYEKIKEIYTNSYITVFSTVEIGTGGRSWTESLSRGAPVLAFHGRGHIEDYLKHKETAYFVDCNINSLVEGFKELFENKELWYKLRINGWKYAKENLIASKVIPKLIKIYREILAK